MTETTTKPAWMEAAAKEAWERVKRQKIDSEEQNKYARYQSDPIGFCENVLGVDRLTDDIKQVMLSVRDNPITIARSANAIGKSFGSARQAIWFYKCFPNSKVFLTAAPPLENLKRILWGEIMATVNKNRDVFANDRITTLSITRHSESFILGVAIPTSGSTQEREGKFSGKHAPYMLFIVDEGDAVPDEVYKGIESCMSGGMARLLIMFNPRHQSGNIYQKEISRQANVVELSAFDHPNVITGRDVIPGAVSREITVRRINMWTRPLVEKEPFDAECVELPPYLLGAAAKGLDGVDYPPLVEKTRKVIDPAFFYMVMGKYPSQSESQLISRAWIDRARDRYDEYVKTYGDRPPPNVNPLLGLDVGEYGSDPSVLCRRYDYYVPRMKFRIGNDPDMVADWAINEYLDYDAEMIYVDGTGPGAAVAPKMSRAKNRLTDIGSNIRAISVKVSNRPSLAIKTEQGEFYQLRDQLWWATREWLRTDERATLPPDPFLVEELQVPTYQTRETDGKIKIMSKERMRELLRRSPDRADALCLTFTPIKRAKIIRLSG